MHKDDIAILEVSGSGSVVCKREELSRVWNSRVRLAVAWLLGGRGQRALLLLRLLAWLAWKPRVGNTTRGHRVDQGARTFASGENIVLEAFVELEAPVELLEAPRHGSEYDPEEGDESGDLREEAPPGLDLVLVQPDVRGQCDA